jgi:hypothetical protein
LISEENKFVWETESSLNYFCSAKVHNGIEWSAEKGLIVLTNETNLLYLLLGIPVLIFILLIIGLAKWCTLSLKKKKKYRPRRISFTYDIPPVSPRVLQVESTDDPEYSEIPIYEEINLQNRNQEQIDVNTSPDVSQVPIYQNVTKF